MVKVIQTFLCWLIRTCRKMSMIACRLFSGFIQIVNKQSCLIWILHKVSETTSNDLFSWSREIGWKCLSFPSFLVFHCIAMCLTVNEKKKTKTCWKYLVTSFFYRSEIEHKKKRWAMPFSSWNYFYLVNVCEETFICFSAEFTHFDWKKCKSKYKVVECHEFSFKQLRHSPQSNNNILNFCKAYSGSLSGKCT